MEHTNVALDNSSCLRTSFLEYWSEITDLNTKYIGVARERHGLARQKKLRQPSSVFSKSVSPFCQFVGALEDINWMYVSDQTKSGTT